MSGAKSAVVSFEPSSDACDISDGRIADFSNLSRGDRPLVLQRSNGALRVLELKVVRTLQAAVVYRVFFEESEKKFARCLFLDQKRWSIPQKYVVTTIDNCFQMW